MIDVFDYGGWFEQTFGHAPKHRLLTWKVALGLLYQCGGRIIVETGCQRQEGDWGAGCSTLVFSRALKALMPDGRLHSVDYSPANIETALSVVKSIGAEQVVQFHCADSVTFLQRFEGPIDLLYLDSLDYGPDESTVALCQSHQLEEVRAAVGKIAKSGVILLDDNHLPGGGKTRLAKTFLRENGWWCILDWQQSVWTRGFCCDARVPLQDDIGT